MDNNTQIILAVVTLLGSAGIWKYAEARLRVKAELRKEEQSSNDTVLYRDDLKSRGEEMDKALKEAHKELLALTEKVAKLETENSFLRREIDILKRN
jgi:predicted phage gp36 major capsid-like protein